MRYLLFFGFLALTACTTSEQALGIIGPRYIDRNADMFFIENGPPISQYKLGDGSTIYRWGTGEGRVNMPGTTTFNAYHTTTGIAGSATTWDAYDITITCDVELVADRENIVREIRIVRDSVGAIEASRCHEYFAALKQPLEAQPKYEPHTPAILPPNSLGKRPKADGPPLKL
jgi:hypothetical protein